MRTGLVILSVVSVLLFLTAVGLALGDANMGPWARRVSGIFAALVPFMYGALKGPGLANHTEAESLQQLRNLLRESESLIWNE